MGGDIYGISTGGVKGERRGTRRISREKMDSNLQEIMFSFFNTKRKKPASKRGKQERERRQIGK